MCRWLAYQGSPIFIDTLVIKPTHSLLMQSKFARQNYVTGLPDFLDGAYPTNADGFGIGWYRDRPEPGLYRDLRPAWSDENLLSLTRQIRSGLFFAHIRAAYDGQVQRTNSHPFSHQRWMFQHNGEIPEFHKIVRDLNMQIDPELYPEIKGTTDSETCFYLALTLGLDKDVKAALQEMIRRVEQARQDAGIEDAFRFTASLSDGETIYAIRYASHGPQKTMYVSNGIKALRQLDEQQRENIPDDAVIVLSEPLDDCAEHWREVPENSLVTVRGGKVGIENFSL